MSKADVARSIERVASVHGIDPAALKAVVEVESNGLVFADIDGWEMPVMRFEGHYFDRLVTASRRDEARCRGLASLTVGGVKDPASQKAPWQLLGRARTIDKQAALEGSPSASGRSWGATGGARLSIRH